MCGGGSQANPRNLVVAALIVPAAPRGRRRRAVRTMWRQPLLAPAPPQGYGTERAQSGLQRRAAAAAAADGIATVVDAAASPSWRYAVVKAAATAGGNSSSATLAAVPVRHRAAAQRDQCSRSRSSRQRLRAAMLCVHTVTSGTSSSGSDPTAAAAAAAAAMAAVGDDTAAAADGPAATISRQAEAQALAAAHIEDAFLGQVDDQFKVRALCKPLSTRLEDVVVLRLCGLSSCWSCYLARPGWLLLLVESVAAGFIFQAGLADQRCHGYLHCAGSVRAAHVVLHWAVRRSWRCTRPYVRATLHADRGVGGHRFGVLGGDSSGDADQTAVPRAKHLLAQPVERAQAGAAARRGGAESVASFVAAVLAEYLCNVCSCQEMLRRHGRG
jgi:hypothetical protein